MKLLQVTHVRKSPHYFHVRGYLIHPSCKQFIEEVNKNIVSDRSPITIDLDGVCWIDASGLGVLTTLSMCLKRQRRPLSVFTLEGSQPHGMLKELKVMKMIGVRNAIFSKVRKTHDGHRDISDDIRSIFTPVGVDCSYD